jgi:hypothetical protein
VRVERDERKEVEGEEQKVIKMCKDARILMENEFQGGRSIGSVLVRLTDD